MMTLKNQAAVFAGLLIFLCLAGCQPAATAPGSGAAALPAESQVNVTEGGVSQNQTLTPDQVLHSDPEEMSLGDIGEALMLYYSVNKTMPARLTDVQSATDEQLNFISPHSGQPYGYSRDGLVAGNGVKRIVVYDPAPAANGKRWCLEMGPRTPGTALWVETVDVPEAAFKLYAPAGR